MIASKRYYIGITKAISIEHNDAHGACIGLLGEVGRIAGVGGAGEASKSHADKRRTNSSGDGPPSAIGDSSPSPGMTKILFFYYCTFTMRILHLV